jgi:hypothetical protein
MWLIQGLSRAVTTNGGVTARIICRRGAMLLAALALPGCSIVQDWDKPGATKEELVRQEEACEARALKRWPYFSVTKSSNWTSWSCNRSGKNCKPSYQTVYRSVDIYEEGRSRETEACLNENGWTPIPDAARIRWWIKLRQ